MRNAVENPLDSCKDILTEGVRTRHGTCSPGLVNEIRAWTYTESSGTCEGKSWPINPFVRVKVRNNANRKDRSITHAVGSV